MNTQFKKGVLELVVLLAISKKDKYGYQLVSEVGAMMDVNEGTIYPLLKRLVNEYYVHRIGRTGRAKRKGSAYSIIGNFPEKAKLDEIAKFCNFTIKPMLLGEDGMLTEEEIKTPAPPKKRFR